MLLHAELKYEEVFFASRRLIQSSDRTLFLLVHEMKNDHFIAFVYAVINIELTFGPCFVLCEPRKTVYAE